MNGCLNLVRAFLRSRQYSLARATLLSLLATCIDGSLSSTARDLRLPKSDRWLEMRQIVGRVTFSGRNARIGDRLTAVGQTIDTGNDSQAILAIDTNIGFVYVGENTKLRVSSINISPDGGRVTLLNIIKGQVRLKVRRFNNPSSRLEIQTPTGVAGVRGTEFGVGVSPSGKTGISTLESTVAVTAQNQTSLVDGGYSSLVVPDEAPTPAKPTPKIVLNLESISRINNSQARIVGNLDPLFLVFVNRTPVDTGKEGNFDIVTDIRNNCTQNYKPQYENELPPLPKCTVQILVRTPLGSQKSYQLDIPNVIETGK